MIWRCGLIAVLAGLSSQALSSENAPSAASSNYHKEFSDGQNNRVAVGATNCANCHAGRVVQRADGERSVAYDLWRGKENDGVHFRAFATLSSPQSRRMAEALAEYDGSGSDPTKRADCLACHAFGHDIPEAQKGASLDLDDGVSCEACHGRAGDWLGVHVAGDWRERSADEWLQRGMYDTRDVVRWAELCLQCHLGTPEKEVSHTLMGAGHPDLEFELAWDLFGVPKHWRDENTYLNEDEGSWYYARLWAVGQAVTFRESVRRLIRWAQSDAHQPDFALFDCLACHHTLGSADWRAASPRFGPPGQPSWDVSSWVVFRHLVAAIDSGGVGSFQENVDDIRGSLTLASPDRSRVLSAATQLEAATQSLIPRLALRQFDEPLVNHLLKRIAGDAEAIAYSGPQGAAQAYRAMYALYRLALAESAHKPESDEQIQRALLGLRNLLYNEHEQPTPDRFDPERFRALMDTVGKLLGS